MTSTFSFLCRRSLSTALTAFLFLTPGLIWGQTTAATPRAISPIRSQSPAASSPAAVLMNVEAPEHTVSPEADGLDTRWFREVNNAQSEFQTSVFHVTDKSVAVVVVGVPLGCIIYGLAADNREVLNTGILLSASEVLTYSVKYVLKTTIKRSRPYEELTHVVTHDMESADQYSFPSGHTAGAFAMATMLSLRYPKPAVIIPAFIWAGMVGYGRVYNGMHYPSDVLGGAVVGAGSSILTYALRGTVLEVFDRVTGRKSDGESSLLFVPTEHGASAVLSVRF